LFCVPYELPFIAVTERAFTQLVNEQYAVMRRSIAAHERLQRIVLSERGLDALAGGLSTLIGGAALVFDGRGDPLASRTFRPALPTRPPSARWPRSSTTGRATATGARSRPTAASWPAARWRCRSPARRRPRRRCRRRGWSPSRTRAG